MFIKEADARRLFKAAYKGVGLRLAYDGDGLIITGRHWFMQILDEYVPKEIKGLIISLTGQLPELKEELLCNDTGNQQEIYLSFGHERVYKQALQLLKEGNHATAADIILTDSMDYKYRIYTDDAGEAHLVEEKIKEMCMASNCDVGETMYGCFAAKDGSIYWVSDQMAFCLVPAAEEHIRERLREVKRCLLKEE